MNRFTARATRPLLGSIAALLLCVAPRSMAGSAQWMQSPPSGVWNTANNWNPATVPNGATDVATFGTSNTTSVSLSANTQVSSVVFNSGASSFRITVPARLTLTLSGAGIVNNSGITQNFITAVNGTGQNGAIIFSNGASAGTNTGFTNNGATASGGTPGETFFYNNSTASNAVFTNNGGAVSGHNGSDTKFYDNSTAGKGTFTSNGGTVSGAGAGDAEFHNNSGAGSGAFINNGALASGANGGYTEFDDNSNAGSGVFTNNGATVSGAVGGHTEFNNSSTAGNGIFTNNGSTINGAFGGGQTVFYGTSTAGNATLIANSGTGGGGGGIIGFFNDSIGGTATVKVFGNGALDISFHNTPGITIGSVEGTGKVFLGANNLTVGANNVSTTFDGVIQDGSIVSAFFSSSTGTPSAGGSLTKIGTGTLTLTGINTYTGSTTVNAGTLIVNGSIASPKTIINTGGALLGMGMIGGDLTNNSIVAPGNIPVPNGGLQAFLASTGLGSITLNATTFPTSQLTLNVKGNYTQSATGTLAIAYGGSAAGQHTTLAVQGQANLDGTLRIVQINGARLKIGDKVPVVTATAGVVGKFANVVGANLLGETATVSYTVPNQVVLQLGGGSTLNTLQKLGGLTSNTSNAAKALDSAVGDPRAAAIFNVLNADTPKQLLSDVQRFSPQQISAQNSVGNSVSNVHVQNVSHRAEALRSGATGFSSMGFQTSGSSYDSTAGFAGPTGPSDKDGKELAPPPNPRWGGFISGAGQWNRVGDTEQARGYDLDSGGITLGLDYKLTPNFVIGMFLGYTHTSIDIGDGGGIGVDVGKLGLYSTYFKGGFYLDTAVQGGYDGYNSKRAGLGGFARSQSHGGDLNAVIAPGYDFKVGALTIGPTASFQYGYQGTNRFTEHDSLAPLTVDPTHTNSFLSTVGMKATYDWKLGSTIIRPELRLSWQHEYGDVATDVTSSLASGAGSAFTVQGPQIGRDSMLLGAGFAVVWSERVTSYVYYDGEFLRTNYDSSAVSGGFRVTF